MYLKKKIKEKEGNKKYGYIKEKKIPNLEIYISSFSH
jgi:hypothetical protein